MNLIKTSIVVCAFNEELMLSKCLNSIKTNICNQANTNEIIIIDNNSVDTTSDIALKFIEDNNNLMIRYLKIEHVPLTSSRNTAISFCKGEYIVFVDADAIVGENWLVNILSKFNENTHIVAGNVTNYNNQSYFANFIYNSHYKCSLKTSRLIGANMGFKSSVFDMNNGFLAATGNRGDETLFLQQYVKNNPDHLIGFAEDSIVYNDFPNSLTEWLEQQYIGGREYLKISKFNNKNFTIFIQEFLRIVNITFFPHLLIFFFITSSSPLVFIMHLLFFMVRNIYKVKHYYCGCKTLKDQSKILQSILYIPVTFFGTLAIDLGYVVEATLSFNKKIDKTVAKTSKVLSEIKSIKLVD